MSRLNFGDFQRKFVAQKFKFKIKIDRGAFTYYKVLWGMGKRGNRGERMKRVRGEEEKGGRRENSEILKILKLLGGWGGGGSKKPKKCYVICRRSSSQ